MQLVGLAIEIVWIDDGDGFFLGLVGNANIFICVHHHLVGRLDVVVVEALGTGTSAVSSESKRKMGGELRQIRYVVLGGGKSKGKKSNIEQHDKELGAYHGQGSLAGRAESRISVGI